MKKVVCGFLAALVLLVSCGPSLAQAPGIISIFESVQKKLENTETEEADHAGDAQPDAFAMTAQQWIRSFQIAANAQGLTLEQGFSYEPGIYTGQHCYDIVIADAPDYFIGMSVLSDNGVNITMCSMRLASSMLQSKALVEASETLWRVAQAMVAASDPEATTEEIDALCKALCLDLPAALLREETVDTSVERKGLSYMLWASFKTEAFFGDSPDPSDGYIVDFVVQAGGPEERG